MTWHTALDEGNHFIDKNSPLGNPVLAIHKPAYLPLDMGTR